MNESSIEVSAEENCEFALVEVALNQVLEKVGDDVF